MQARPEPLRRGCIKLPTPGPPCIEVFLPPRACRLQSATGPRPHGRWRPDGCLLRHEGGELDLSSPLARRRPPSELGTPMRFVELPCHSETTSTGWIINTSALTHPTFPEGLQTVLHKIAHSSPRASRLQSAAGPRPRGRWRSGECLLRREGIEAGSSPPLAPEESSGGPRTPVRLVDLPYRGVHFCFGLIKPPRKGFRPSCIQVFYPLHRACRLQSAAGLDPMGVGGPTVPPSSPQGG
jgi:hypothetical protein